MQEHNVLSYIMPDANFIDDLEYLNKLSENKTIDNEALVKLFVLYRPNTALAENLAVRLKLSRKEKQLFVALAEENTDLSLFNNEGDLKKLIYHYGKDFAKAKLLVEEAFSKTGLANLWQIYDSISTMQDLVFPLKGKDILELKIYKESQIGLILKNLEIEWVSSSFTMSKEQLLSKAESYHKLSSEDFKENYLSDRNIV
jgi:tRNA nucleotidyltransferase/poly(A) polymerase